MSCQGSLAPVKRKERQGSSLCRPLLWAPGSGTPSQALELLCTNNKYSRLLNALSLHTLERKWLQANLVNAAVSLQTWRVGLVTDWPCSICLFSQRRSGGVRLGDRRELNLHHSCTGSTGKMRMISPHRLPWLRPSATSGTPHPAIFPAANPSTISPFLKRHLATTLSSKICNLTHKKLPSSFPQNLG